MCRILSYLGQPISMEELFYQPDNSFIKQSYHPIYMSHILNLAGFGMVAWDRHTKHPTLPFVYKTESLPFYDENLRNLTQKISPYCVLAHLRGVSYNEKEVVSVQNVHPFMFDKSHIALAHNGVLIDFEKMKFDLLDYIHPTFQQAIRGTTDSEWIYAVFISQLTKKTRAHSITDIAAAIIATLKIIKSIRHKHHITYASPVNLFISDGNFIAATRFVFDYGWQPHNDLSTHSAYHSLWYTYGETYGYYDNEYRMRGANKRTSIIIASEPLTEDTTTWIEIPEYTLIVAQLENDLVNIYSEDISL